MDHLPGASEYPVIPLVLQNTEPATDKEQYDAYCQLLEQGYTYRQIHAMNKHPRVRRPPLRRDQFLRLLFSEDTWYRARFNEADRIILASFRDELIDIADNSTNDWVEREGKDGEREFVENGEHLRRTKIRLDTRKWLLEKLDHKQFGNNVTVRGDASAPMQNVSMTREEFLALAREAKDKI